MRRGVGVTGIVDKKLKQEKLKQLGGEIESVRMENMKERLEFFRANLEEFARKHKKDINKDPVFRHHFSQMCLKIGVDPLASRKGFWAEMLGIGDFYYELGVQIIEICMKTRNQNGGLIEMSELLSRLTKIRNKYSKNESAQEISADDVEQAISHIKHLGNGFQILRIGNQIVVQSVPAALSNDHTSVLALIVSQIQQQQNNSKSASLISAGCVTRDALMQQLNWTSDRVDAALKTLMQEGFAWIDTQGGSTQYWFPGLIDMEKMEM